MALKGLVNYQLSDDEEEPESQEPSTSSAGLLPIPEPSSIVPKLPNVDTAPFVDESLGARLSQNTLALHLVADQKNELTFNVKYDEMYAPKVGPQRAGETVRKNCVESAFIGDAQFEHERRRQQAPLKPDIKVKRLRNDDGTDIDNYVGPWAPVENEEELKVARPSETEMKEMAEWEAKKRRLGKKPEEAKFEEKSTLHIKDPYDYQGRSFLVPSQEIEGRTKPSDIPHKCFLPKKVIHTFVGHTKAINCIRWFPRTAHLFMSASMDSKIKLWEVYGERRQVQTYMGHKQAVRDIAFTAKGEQFLSSGYDRHIKLWDTETGSCIKRFSNRKVAFSIKFFPENESMFLAGMADKKILCFDTRSGSVAQEYDRHLGAINTVTFVDNNRRFISTSDDKSIRVWEWDIPVDVKYIADPTLHAIPVVTKSPNGKWLAMQSMDNKIHSFALMNRFKLHSKKEFTGHMVAGYACAPDFSPDMSYLVSGDADGKVFIWDWKTTKLLNSFQAHENVCIASLWHPHETSKVLTAGWDNLIKLWD